MSKQWNQVCSVTKESTLMDVMSEEFSKRLQIDEDFVWVEMPEAVPEVYRTSNIGHFEEKTENQSPSQTSSKVTIVVVQSVIRNAGLEPLEEKKSDQSDDDGDILPRNEEMIETEYDNQFTRNKVKAINPSQTKYPKPYWMKKREHGTVNTEKRQFPKQNNDKMNSKKQINELLPKMKFDASTTAILEMLINNRYLERYNHFVGKGKNSVVFHADVSRKNCATMPFENVVKIYKIGKDEEKNKVIYRKVQREFKHLSMLRLRWFKHPIQFYGFPAPIRAWKNVILMGFMGYDSEVAPSIQDAPHEVDEELYNGIVNFIDTCYNSVQLVHGKLSAANILNRFKFKSTYFIGWSHSVKSDHPLAMTKLIKDCHFLTEFYKRRGVKVMQLKDLVQKITMQEPNEKLLEAIQGTKDLYSKYDTNPNRRTGRVRPPAPTNNRFKE